MHEKEDEKTWRNYDNSLSFNYQAGQIFHLLLQEFFKTFNMLPPFLACPQWQSFEDKGQVGVDVYLKISSRLFFYLNFIDLQTSLQKTKCFN